MIVGSGIRHTLGVLLVSGFVLGSVATAQAAPRVYVHIGPPAPIVQVRPVAPGAGYVWAPGYYRWNQRTYDWTPGQWVRPPRRHEVWVAPQWVHTRNGWYMVPGHWR